MMYSSLEPVRPREMAATALTLGSGSLMSVIRASITAGFWKVAVCVCVCEFSCVREYVCEHVSE